MTNNKPERARRYLIGKNDYYEPAIKMTYKSVIICVCLNKAVIME